MLEQDLTALDAREPLHLDKLVPDIWRRERITVMVKRFLASGQAVILGLAILASAVVGIVSVAQPDKPSLTVEEKLTPSHLLLGSKP